MPSAACSTSAATEESYKFTGKERDSESNLDNFDELVVIHFDFCGGFFDFGSRLLKSPMGIPSQQAATCTTILPL
jgi:hypothetical protein